MAAPRVDYAADALVPPALNTTTLPGAGLSGPAGRRAALAVARVGKRSAGASLEPDDRCRLVEPRELLLGPRRRDVPLRTVDVPADAGADDGETVRRYLGLGIPPVGREVVAGHRVLVPRQFRCLRESGHRKVGSPVRGAATRRQREQALLERLR